MTRLEIMSGLVMLCGATLWLSTRRWCARRPLVDRLGPYLSRRPRPHRPLEVLSVASIRDVIAPLAADAGARLARTLGMSDDLDRRLQRLHSSLDAAQFRSRQIGWSLLALVGGCAAAAAIRPASPVAMALSLVPGCAVFVIIEQRLTAASRRYQARLFHELPVVAEQLGMLLAAGYSLTGSLHRLARRGRGVVARDLQRLAARMAQGVGVSQALREWADIAGVDALERLVGVLALDHEGGDLGALISDEARAARRDAHRELIEAIERKDQLVWIPVAIAALVPGTILIAVPFIQALRTFSGA